MLEFVSSGLLSTWLNSAGISQLVASAEPIGWQELPWVGLPGESDAIALTTLQHYLKGLSTKGLNPATQGVWLQSGPVRLASHQGTTPVPAASLTKVATSLVALKTWGADRRFETRISTNGIIQNGMLQGDLIVQDGGDPVIEWKEAVTIGNALNHLGITRVTGNLVIVGDLMVSFETDRPKAGELLKQAWSARTWTEDFESSYQELPPGTPRPEVTIAGSVQIVPSGNLYPAKQVLLRHHSLPLAQILKWMNVESNNEIAEALATLLGGAGVVAHQSAQFAGVPPDEILLRNGSGLGLENRLSPRAVCALFAAVQRVAQSYDRTVADLFPVAGLDQGTIDGRKIPPASVVKTGTLNEVSALAGVLPTRDRGPIWFAIINRGAAIGELRHQQDGLLRSLVQQWGTARTVPIAIVPASPIHDISKVLGETQRNELVPSALEVGR